MPIKLSREQAQRFYQNQQQLEQLVPELNEDQFRQYNELKEAAERWYDPKSGKFYQYSTDESNVIAEQTKRKAVPPPTAYGDPNAEQNRFPSAWEQIKETTAGVADIPKGLYKSAVEPDIPGVPNKYARMVPQAGLTHNMVVKPVVEGISRAANAPMLSKDRVMGSLGAATFGATDFLEGVIDPLAQPFQKVLKNEASTRQEMLAANRASGQAGFALATAGGPRGIRHANVPFNPILNPQSYSRRAVKKGIDTVRAGRETLHEYKPRHVFTPDLNLTDGQLPARSPADVLNAARAETASASQTLGHKGTNRRTRRAAPPPVTQQQARQIMTATDRASDLTKRSLHGAEASRLHEEVAPAAISQRFGPYIAEPEARFERGEDWDIAFYDEFKNKVPKTPEQIAMRKDQIHTELDNLLSKQPFNMLRATDDQLVQYVLDEPMAKSADYILSGEYPARLKNIAARYKQTRTVTASDYRILDLYRKADPKSLPQPLVETLNYIDYIRRRTGGDWSPRNLNRLKKERYDDIPERELLGDMTDDVKTAAAIRHGQATGLRRLLDDLTAGPDGRSMITENNRRYAELSAVHEAYKRMDLKGRVKHAFGDLVMAATGAMGWGGAAAGGGALLATLAGGNPLIGATVAGGLTGAIALPFKLMGAKGLREVILSPKTAMASTKMHKGFAIARGFKEPKRVPAGPPGMPPAQLQTIPPPPGAPPPPPQQAPPGYVVVTRPQLPPAPGGGQQKLLPPVPPPGGGAGSGGGTGPSGPSGPGAGTPPTDRFAGQAARRAQAATPAQKQLANQIFELSRTGKEREMVELWSKHKDELVSSGAVTPGKAQWYDKKTEKWQQWEATRAEREARKELERQLKETNPRQRRPQEPKEKKEKKPRQPAPPPTEGQEVREMFQPVVERVGVAKVYAEMSDDQFARSIAVLDEEIAKAEKEGRTRSAQNLKNRRGQAMKARGVEVADETPAATPSTPQTSEAPTPVPPPTADTPAPAGEQKAAKPNKQTKVVTKLEQIASKIAREGNDPDAVKGLTDEGIRLWSKHRDEIVSSGTLSENTVGMLDQLFPGKRESTPAPAPSTAPAATPEATPKPVLSEKMKADLRRGGYTDEQISTLTPQQAHDILEKVRPGQSSGNLRSSHPPVDRDDTPADAPRTQTEQLGPAATPDADADLRPLPDRDLLDYLELSKRANFEKGITDATAELDRRISGGTARPATTPEPEPQRPPTRTASETHGTSGVDDAREAPKERYSSADGKLRELDFHSGIKRGGTAYIMGTEMIAVRKIVEIKGAVRVQDTTGRWHPIEQVSPRRGGSGGGGGSTPSKPPGTEPAGALPDDARKSAQKQQIEQYYRLMDYIRMKTGIDPLDLSPQERAKFIQEHYPDPMYPSSAKTRTPTGGSSGGGSSPRKPPK